VLIPRFEVVRQRGEEPRPESPITYREVAYAVSPGCTRAQVEALLWSRYQDVAASIEASPPGKFVQLAVFDHVFQKRPERPPLATFAWKDWRGSPVLAFPGFGDAPAGPVSQVPPSLGSIPAGAGPSAAPLAAASGFPSVAAAPVVAPQVPVSAPPPAVVAAAPSAAAPVAPASTQAAPPAASVPPTEVASASPELSPAPAAAAPAAAAEPGLDISFDSTPFHAPIRKSSPDAERQSRPRLATPARRRAGEDLISELFELMHELHFMRDVAAGADFLLSVLNEVLPCDGVLIHVFDINTNHFVVVRAKGPNARAVLLQRMPDQDPLALSVMRSPQAVSVKDAASDARFTGPRWQAVGVAPKAALCGAVRQGGRYLGMIELVNPEGGTPFHASELNALDYICEQFAEFLSNRPIIVAADVILPKN
jgi:hypothetical protein